MSEPEHIAPEAAAAIEAIASGCMNLIRDFLIDELMGSARRPPQSNRFDATAAEIAERVGMSAAWIRANADALGGVRMGSGDRPRLRFNSAIVDERIGAMGSKPRTRPRPITRSPQRRRTRPSGPDLPLLPIKGRAQ